MHEPDPPASNHDGSADLMARVAELERRVAELEAGAAIRPPPPPPLRRAWNVMPPPLARLAGVSVPEAESEDILGKVGIGLLLVGVVFLLKYTIDRELLTPAVRVAGAAAIGVVLLVMGQRLRSRRRVLGRLLAGGGVAALFGSLWTASALYPLLPPVVALAGMAAVAGVTLALAVKEQDAALSVVGTLGALMTPLLLYRDPGQVALLTAYMTIVVGAAGWTYARHDWPELVGSAAVGAWSVLMVAWLVGIQPDIATTGDRAAFTVAVLVTWLVAGALPIRRLWQSDRPRPATVLRVEPAVALLSPVIAFAFLSAAWAWSAGVAAVLLVALASGYALAAHRLRGSPAAFEALVLAAGLLGAWGVARWFGVADARSMGVAVGLACGVVWVARREAHDELKFVGHVAALGLACALLIEQYLAPGGFFSDVRPLETNHVLREVAGAVVGAGGLAYVGFTSGRGSTSRYAYLTAAHLVVSLLARTLLLPLPSGAALTSTTWAVYAVGLVVAGLRTRDDVLRQIGLGTILVTVAKVLLIDLASIPTLWRVLLFMGLGTLMLLVSYFVPALLRGRGVSETEGAGGPEQGDG